LTGRLFSCEQNGPAREQPARRRSGRTRPAGVL